MTVIHNGVPAVFFSDLSAPRVPARLIYTSQARRGLSVLLELFPEIRAAVPEAQLQVFAYDESGPSSGETGVVMRGAVDKRQLAAELQQAAVFVYPCTFSETFCTSVAEAQAAGLPVVTTGLAALNERVDHDRDGYLVAGPADSPSARREFADTVIGLLRDNATRGRMGGEALGKARRCYDWEAVASQWERVLLPCADRPVRPPRLDPQLDLLAPELLHLSDRGASADVPAALAEEWLRDQWATYGLDPAGTPGLPGVSGRAGPASTGPANREHLSGYRAD
jgi:glycosyltransferase involved in cell wall biosynthesis